MQNTDLNPQRMYRRKTAVGAELIKTNEQKIAKSQKKNNSKCLKMRNFQLQKNKAHQLMVECLFVSRRCGARSDYVRRAADDDSGDCSENLFLSFFFRRSPSDQTRSAGWLKDLCTASHMRLSPL